MPGYSFKHNDEVFYRKYFFFKPKDLQSLTIEYLIFFTEFPL